MHLYALFHRRCIACYDILLPGLILLMCFVRPAVSVATVRVQHIKRFLTRQCCHLVLLCYIVLSMPNRIFSVSLENTARMETMAKQCPMNNRGFQIGVARRLFRGPITFVAPILITSSRKSPKTVIP